MESDEKILYALAKIEAHCKEINASTGYIFIVVLYGVTYAILRSEGISMWWGLVIIAITILSWLHLMGKLRL